MVMVIRALLTAILISTLLPNAALSDHHEKQKIMDPLAQAEAFPLLLRRTTLIPTTVAGADMAFLVFFVLLQKTGQHISIIFLFSCIRF